MGVDPLKTAIETITVLDKYISAGIGYARSISYKPIPMGQRGKYNHRDPGHFNLVLSRDGKIQQ
jgi:hypothetical protein